MLSYYELCELVEAGVLTDVAPERINAASIDITLSPRVMIEQMRTELTARSLEVDLAAKPRQYPAFIELDMSASGLLMPPGMFLLASSVETFNLPDDICANYFLNSSLARAGLNAALAMWCDPGWNGSQLTLELKNWTVFHHLRLRPGMKIGQMVFHRVTPVPADRSYRAVGSYNQASGPVVR